MAQTFEPQISVYKDSLFHEVEILQFASVDSFASSLKFENIPSKWTILLVLNYDSITYQIPLDSNVHSIVVVPNSKAKGFCNRITYWTACDAIQVYEHGNGCTDMNDVIINCCDKERACTIMEGVRVIPFYYSSTKKQKRKRKK